VPSLSTVVLSLAIATLYAALFHLLWGKSLKELIRHWLAALLGFGAGQLLASGLNWRDVRIGELHVLSASVFCWLSVFLVRRVRL
jgi:hypothetical protein